MWFRMSRLVAVLLWQLEIRQSERQTHKATTQVVVILWVEKYLDEWRCRPLCVWRSDCWWGTACEPAFAPARPGPAQA
jgi:hypothetical protein